MPKTKYYIHYIDKEGKKGSYDAGFSKENVERIARLNTGGGAMWQSYTISTKPPAPPEEPKEPPEKPTGEPTLGFKSETEEALFREISRRVGEYQTGDPTITIQTRFGISKLSREQYVEHLVGTHGEQYREFIIDTVYKHLRRPDLGEPEYYAPPGTTYGIESETGDPYWDEFLRLIRAQFPDPAEITKEKLDEFLKQAEAEVDPYYQSQLKLAREDLSRALGYTREDILAQEAELERKYGVGVRRIGEEMAERGFAISGPRLRAERELATGTQFDIEQARRRALFGAGTEARKFAQLWGTTQLPTMTMPGAPRVLAGVPGFERGAEAPLYTISPEVYEGLVGEKEWEAKAEKRRRVAELEEAFRTKGARALTI